MFNFIIKTLMFIAFIIPAITYAETAKIAWEGLVGTKFVERPEFKYVQNVASLPNVLIYGDSISIHYTQDVRNELKGKANIYRLYRNGAESATVIGKMNKMLDLMTNPELDDHWSFNWDVIHFNVGLHDLKYVKGRKLDKVNGTQVSTLEEYQKNLTEIIHYFKKLAPNAKLVFATTTPVPEGALGRVAGDSVKYNIAALAVLKKYPEIVVNDLYSFTKPNQEQWWLKPGDVHFAQQGHMAQGKEVARIISQSLDMK